MQRASDARQGTDTSTLTQLGKTLETKTLGAGRGLQSFPPQRLGPRASAGIADENIRHRSLHCFVSVSGDGWSRQGARNGHRLPCTIARSTRKSARVHVATRHLQVAAIDVVARSGERTSARAHGLASGMVSGDGRWRLHGQPCVHRRLHPVVVRRGKLWKPDASSVRGVGSGWKRVAVCGHDPLEERRQGDATISGERVKSVGHQPILCVSQGRQG